MTGMYKIRTTSFITLGLAGFVFALALWVVRSQTKVTDTDCIQAVFPNYSIAFMTCKRAHIRNPRICKLAHEIISAQRREMAQIKYLIKDIEKNCV
ncbi:DUF305 domain-containing protein, partial [Croceicoccus sp. F390]|nr:DUF305 domain-containing protein [Croceicoccus sp. F390]